MAFAPSKLPAHSTLWRHHNAGDFMDCYSCASELAPETAMQQALAMPSWAQALLNLRNVLVKPLGLKTDASQEGADDAIFPITHRSDDEILIGTNDKHLDFRIAILRDQGQIYMSSWVHPHNLMGQIYLHMVMPFHVLIVRNCMRRLAHGAS